MRVKFIFRPTLWPSIAACFGILATLALGNWQLGRAQEKIALQQRLESANSSPLLAVPTHAVDARSYEWRRVAVTGRFVPKYSVLLDNRILQGVVGYEVVTPLRIDGSEKHILVDRGWIQAETRREHLPTITTPAGVVHISGLAVVPSRQFLELTDQTVSGAVWENLVIERYRKLVPLNIHGFIIEQQNSLDDGLKRSARRPHDSGVAKHQSYALQWFALCALIFIIYTVTNVRQQNK